MASIWRLNDQNFWVLSQNDESDQTTKVIKAQWIASIWRQNDLKSWVTSLNYKVIKLQWIASIWHQNNPKCWDTSQNIQNNANQRKSSNYNAWHRFDVLMIKTFELRRKTTKVIKLYCIASIWRLNDQNIWVTSLNYKSNQITMDCIDLTSKQSKMLRYVAKHSKQRKPTKVIKL